MTLRDFFAQYPKAALGLSGGVDSSYLLYEASRHGADVRAYFIQTPFQPAFEREDAQRLAESLGAAFRVLPFDVLSLPEVAANDAERCYHCKTALFGLLRRAAREDGYELLLDGSNASDDASDRPGMRALAELGVRSPLRECGLGKDDIRRAAKEAGLDIWNKPAYACLATRVPTGSPLTYDLLERVDAAERHMEALGFSDFRVRVYHGAARIQLKPEQFTLAVEKRAAIVEGIRPFFDPALLDLTER